MITIVNALAVIFLIYWGIHFYFLKRWQLKAKWLADELHAEVMFGFGYCDFQWYSFGEETEICIYRVYKSEFDNMNKLREELRSIKQMWLEEIQ